MGSPLTPVPAKIFMGTSCEMEPSLLADLDAIGRYWQERSGKVTKKKDNQKYSNSQSFLNCLCQSKASLINTPSTSMCSIVAHFSCILRLEDWCQQTCSTSVSTVTQRNTIKSAIP